MNQSIGEKIIAAIPPLIREVSNGGRVLDVVWHPYAAEQLEAVVEAHIEERVRVRLELDRQAIRSTDIFGELARKYSLAVESLTEEQLAEGIRQAIASGDFQRHVLNEGGSHKQAVVYIPYREVSRIRPRYEELIYAVATKHEGETQHETALRYITERQNHPQSEAQDSKAAPQYPSD